MANTCMYTLFIPVFWSFSIDVIPSATSGGQKTGRGGQTGGGFSRRDIVGLEATVRARFRFDLHPPTHCILQNNGDASNCPCFPIYLENDVTTVSIDQYSSLILSFKSHVKLYLFTVTKALFLILLYS